MRQWLSGFLAVSCASRAPGRWLTCSGMGVCWLPLWFWSLRSSALEDFVDLTVSTLSLGIAPFALVSASWEGGMPLQCNAGLFAEGLAGP